LLAVLASANALSSIDRFAISLLVVPMKHDLHITDTQIALLQGIAFAIFYTTLSIPIARLADRSTRKFLVAASVALWSTMTMTFGLMSSFAGLFIARVGVGCGESTLNPIAYGMLADAFPKRKVATAVGIYTIGLYVGSGGALFGIAALLHYLSQIPPVVLPVLGHVADWRLVFLILGPPGFLVALLSLFVVEPSRTGVTPALQAGRSMPIAAIASFFGRRWKFFFCLTGGTSLLAIYGYGSGAWLPTFFVRTYGWSVVDVGYRCGLIGLIFAPLGSVISGVVAQMFGRMGVREPELLTAALSGALLIPSVLTMLLAHSPWVSLGLMCVTTFLGGFAYPLVAAALQAVAPNQIRVQVTALHLLVVNLISLVFGPLTVALLTDKFFHQEKLLFLSLAIVAAVVLPLSAILYGLGRRFYHSAMAEHANS
jgi:MFS family permease